MKIVRAWALLLFYCVEWVWRPSVARHWKKARVILDWAYRVGLTTLLFGMCLTYCADVHEALNTRFAGDVGWMRWLSRKCLIVSNLVAALVGAAYLYNRYKHRPSEGLSAAVSGLAIGRSAER